MELADGAPWPSHLPTHPPACLPTWALVEGILSVIKTGKMFVWNALGKYLDEAHGGGGSLCCAAVWRVQVGHAQILLQMSGLVWAFWLHCRLLKEENILGTDSDLWFSLLCGFFVNLNFSWFDFRVIWALEWEGVKKRRGWLDILQRVGGRECGLKGIIWRKMSG